MLSSLPRRRWFASGAERMGTVELTWASSPLVHLPNPTACVVTRGAHYDPPYHGRVQVAILGEELSNGTLCPPRLRPLPNSPVFTLSDEESAAVLKVAGDIRLGMVVGHKNVIVGV